MIPFKIKTFWFLLVECVRWGNAFVRTLYIKLSIIRNGSWSIWSLKNIFVSLQNDCVISLLLLFLNNFHTLNTKIMYLGKIWGPKNVLKTNGILEWYFLVFVNQNCVYKARTRRNFELSFHFCTIDFDARISDSVYLRATKRESLSTKMQ